MTKIDGADAYPLAWPGGWPRTKRRERSRFGGRFANVRDELMREICLLGGRYIVLSTNVPLRRDGLPYANQAEPSDPAVAVYFERRGRQMVFACDKWDRTKDNMRAIQKTIEAIRGIERWGASEMMERAFQAFEALPPPTHWSTVLGVPKAASREDIERAYRERAKATHPDVGGTAEAMAALTAARDQALQERSAN
jgi:hypothetical protein